MTEYLITYFYYFFLCEGVPKVWSKGIGLGLITLVVSGVRISSPSYKILLLLLLLFFRFDFKQSIIGGTLRV